MSEMTCKVALESPVGLAAAKDHSRYAMQNVGVYPTGKGKGIAVATDGKMLAAREVDAELLTAPAFIPGKLAKKAGKFSLNGEWRREQFGRSSKVEIAPVADEGRFPPVKSVVEEMKDLDGQFIVLDASLLATVQESLGAASLVMQIPENHRHPVKLIGRDASGAYCGVGLVMPIHGGNAPGLEHAERQKHVEYFNAQRNMLPEKTG